MTGSRRPASKHDRDPRSKRIAFCAVLTTMLAAVVGYAQSEASKDSGASSIAAQQLSAAAVAEADRSIEQVYLQLEYYVRQQLHLRGAALDQELERFSSLPDGELRLDQRNQEALAQVAHRRAALIGQSKTSAATPITEASVDGPNKDPLFPTRYFAANRRSAVALVARSDAATAYADDRGSQVAAYVAILAIFAVAVYLYGFSLSEHGTPNRPLLATAATALALFGLGWGIHTALQTPSRPDDRAAEAYAEGEVLAESGQWAAATKAYDRAIALRPDFGLAYKHRALARFFADSPQAHESMTGNLSSPEAFEGMISDIERARDLGLADASVINNQGFAYLLLGIQHRDPDRIRSGIELLRQADELNPNQVDLGPPIGYLVLGQPELAAAGFERSAHETVFGADGRPRDPAEVQSLLGGSLTDLEVVAASYPELADEVVAAKEQLIGRVSEQTAAAAADDTEAGAAPAVDSLEAFAWAGGVEASVDLDQLQPDRHRTWVEWYRKDPDLGWFVMPAASGSPANEADLPPATKNYVLRWQRSGSTWFADSDYLRSGAQAVCLPPAQYKVELYVDGRLADTDTYDASLPALDPAQDQVIGSRICRPDSWQPSDEALPGLVNGFVDPTGARGIYVIRLANSDGLGSQVSSTTPPGKALDRILPQFRNLLPGTPSSPEELSVPFLGASEEVVRQYSYPGGKLRVGASRQPDGSVFVGLVFGPDSWWSSSDEPVQIFHAISDW